MNATNQEATSPQSPAPNSSWLKTFSIGFSIISFGITIAIVGYIVLTTKQQQTVNQQPISTSPTISAVSPAPNGVGANWKTHRNTKYAYEVKYPSSFNTKEYGDYIQFTDGVMDLSIINYNTGVDQPILNTEQIKIGGENAKKYNHILGKFPDQVGFIIIHFSHNNKEFTITSQSLDQKPLSKDQIKTIDQILSTFKFTQ